MKIDFEQWLTNQGKSENTIKTYVGVLNKFNCWLDDRGKSLSGIGQEDVQYYMDDLKEQGRTASTIDKVYACIRVYSHYINKPHIVDNIKRMLKERNIYQTIPQFLSEEEKLQLLREVENDKDLRNIAIINLLLFTGIRISELCNLDYSDVEINGQKGMLTVKGEKARKIPIPVQAVYQIKRYNETFGEPNRPLFVSKQNKRLTIRSIQYMLEKKYNINSHKLRNTFCQDLIKKGIDISVVAQLAGYNDLNMVKRYKQKRKISIA